MLIEKNTICYISEVGYNNFFYPSNSKVIVRENCEVQRMTWIGGGTKVAVKILKAMLIPADLCPNITKNISPPNKNGYTIVWVEKDV